MLTIRLEAREGDWHPDAESKPGVTVRAFGVEGGALQIPGPAIRVVAGTELHAFVRNGLSGQRLFMHGLSARDTERAGPDTLSIAPGEVRDVRFTAGRVGTYYYWGATTTNPVLARRSGGDSQLNGAFVVEPRNEPHLADRLFLLGLWEDSVGAGSQRVRVGRFVINGKSWPNTERLTYQVGDTVRMRVMNVGLAVHPMHLLGSHASPPHVGICGSWPVSILAARRLSRRSATLWKATECRRVRCPHISPGRPSC